MGRCRAYRWADSLLTQPQRIQLDGAPGVVIAQQLQQLIGEVAKACQILHHALEALHVIKKAELVRNCADHTDK